MKRTLKLFTGVALMALLVYACEDTLDQAPAVQDEIPQAILDKLMDAGYSPDDVFKTEWNGEEGYVVEYDLFFTEEAIDQLVQHDHIPNTEHYRTTNLVTGLPRVIKVALDPSFSQTARNAFLETLAIYNAENLTLTFEEATITVSGKGRKQTVTTDADIVISAFKERPRRGFITLGRAAGFPTSSGDPAEGFGLNTYWIDNFGPSQTEIRGVMLHEIGHCIGFRHTDYMTRESCGSNVNEGDAGVGAIYIPGTPTGSDATSWMQACGPADDFNNNDRVALDALY